MSFVVFALLVLLLLVSAVSIAGGVVRATNSARRIRRAGIGPYRPGCPACLYPLGGWTSPRCPECATDVAEHGVCARSDARRHARLVVATVLSLWVGVATFGPVAGYLVGAGDERVETHARSQVDRDVYALIAAERVWSRIPPRSRRTVTVELFDTVAAKDELSFADARRAGMAGLRSATITVAGPPAEPATDHEAHVRRALADLTQDRLSPEHCDAHAASIAAAIHAGLRPPDGRGASSPTVRAPFARTGGWSIRTVGPGDVRELVAVTGTLIAVFALTLPVRRFIRRRTPLGTRPPAPDEWATGRAAGLSPADFA